MSVFTCFPKETHNKMELKYILFGALLCQAAVSIQSTANPNANEKTKKLLATMSEIGDKILSGAFGGYNLFDHEVGFSMEQANGIQQSTNKLPAVYGMDCSPGWKTTDEGHETDIIDCFHQQMVDYAKKGGIITISHHFPNPVFAGNKVVEKGTLTNAQYATILQNGTPARNRWLSMMEKIAQGLKAYKDQGVTVLYRPFHEMNGDWFWWSAVPDESQNGERQRLFKLLWQDLFNFMKNKGLDNLLWVYSPDQSRGSKTAYYPGDNYVDIVGLDWYTEDPNNSVNGYEELTGLGKPFAFAEVGPYGPAQGNFDFELFIKNIVSRYPKAIFFMPWNGITSPLKNKNIWGVYNNPKVVNLGELNVR